MNSSGGKLRGRSRDHASEFRRGVGGSTAISIGCYRRPMWGTGPLLINGTAFTERAVTWMEYMATAAAIAGVTGLFL